MKGVSLRDLIVVDGAMELFRCPNLRTGWPKEALEISFDQQYWPLPPEMSLRKEAWEKQGSAERNDQKIALRCISSRQGGTPRFELQATSWKEVRPLHIGTPIPFDEGVRRGASRCQFLLPNIGVVHVIVTTEDGWVLLFQRGRHSHYHPGAWSGTYEEGLSPEDLLGGSIFHEAARRGLAEEISTDLASVPLDRFTLISVIVETPLCNPAVVIIADLPISLSQLPSSRPSDELEEYSHVAIPMELEALRHFMITSKIRDGERSVGSLHPTSRYRLLMLVSRQFGEYAASEILRDMQNH